jgi:hypothetical protein
MILQGCLGNEVRYVVQRLDKPPENTQGVLRPVERQNLKVYLSGQKDVSPGYVQGGVGPEYILLFEDDFSKLLNSAKAYNEIVKNLNELEKQGKISVEDKNKIIPK